MKICGCANCRHRGEKNPYDDFELYCLTKELEDKVTFEAIFKASYTVEEMTEVYDEFEESFDIAERIQAYLNS